MTFLGIPYHLRTFEVLGSLCKRFGMFKEIADIEPAIGEFSGTSVLVSNCSVNSIPQFLPLVDLGE